MKNPLGKIVREQTKGQSASETQIVYQTKSDLFVFVIAAKIYNLLFSSKFAENKIYILYIRDIHSVLLFIAQLWAYIFRF